MINTTWLTRNLGLKLISLAIALILWLIASGGKNTVRTVTSFDVAPIISIPEGMEIVAQNYKNITIRVSGQTADISRLTKDDFSITVDLSTKNTPGKHDIAVLQYLDYPPQIQINEVDPPNITIELDRTVLRPVELIVPADAISNLPYGKRVERAQVVPPTVLVEGPQKELDKMDAIQVDAVNLPRDVPGDVISMSKRVSLPNAKVRFKDTNGSRQTVNLRIQLADIIKPGDFRRIYIKTIPEGVEVRLAPQTFIDVLVQAPVTVLDEMKQAASQNALYAYIDVSGGDFKKGEKREVEPVLLNEARFKDIKKNPQTLTVTFQESYSQYTKRTQ